MDVVVDLWLQRGFHNSGFTVYTCRCFGLCIFIIANLNKIYKILVIHVSTVLCTIKYTQTLAVFDSGGVHRVDAYIFNIHVQ